MKWILGILLISSFGFAQIDQVNSNVNVFDSWGRTNYTIFNPNGTEGSVVFVHGGVVPGYTWHPQAEFLAQRGFRVLTFDLLGFGHSERPPIARFQQRREDYVRQIKSLTEKLGFERDLILVGSSMGGGLASDFAQIYPGRVNKLILEAPVVDVISSHWLSEFELGDGIDNMHWFIWQRILGNGLRKNYYNTKHCVGLNYRDRNCPYGEEMVNKYYETADREYIEGLKARLETDVFDGLTPVYRALAQTRIPVLIFWGTKDGLVGESQITTILDQFSDNSDQVELVKYPDVDHIVHVQVEDDFNKRLYNFIR